MRYKTVIIGAGVSGLSCAAVLHLADPDAADNVCVLEKMDRPGGKMYSESKDGFLYDTGPITVMDRPPESLELMEMIGLKDRWIPDRPEAVNRYMYKNGRRHKAPGGNPIRMMIEGILTPIMPFFGKIRMCMEPFIPAKDNTEESLRDFATRRLGKAAYENLLGPFTATLQAADPEQLEVESAYPLLSEAERKYHRLVPGMFKLARDLKGGVKRKTMTRSFPNGQKEFPDRIAELLGDRFKPGHTVAEITESGDGYSITVETNGESQEIECDNLVLATEAPPAAKFIENIESLKALHAEISAITYNSMALVQVGVKKADLKQPVDGYGHLVCFGSDHRTLGILYSSSLFDGRVPSDEYALLTNFTGGTLDMEAIDLPDEKILEFVREDLRKSLGFDGDFAMTAIMRWQLAIPQYHIGHAARQRRIEEFLKSKPNLKVIGCYLNGVSVSMCMQNGVLIARELLK